MPEPKPKTDEELSKGDKIKAKYFKSAKGKAALKTYRQSEKGKETQKRYDESPRAKLARSKYYYTDKGQEAHTRRAEKVKSFKALAAWLKENPSKTPQDFPGPQEEGKALK